VTDLFPLIFLYSERFDTSIRSQFPICVYYVGNPIE